MITFVRTRTVAPGKGAEAMAFAQQVPKLIKDKFGVQFNVSMPIGGNADRLAFVASFADLAELESLISKVMGDADYQKLLAANAQTFLPGATHDELWRSL